MTLVVDCDSHVMEPADLWRTWLEPRTVRYYPSRGVTYESHLAPPPHLVGLRIAALDAPEGRREIQILAEITRLRRACC